MKTINPKFEELVKDNPIELGELCARVCYKSEDRIKEGSAKKLISGIASAGHTAMLEHIPVYLKVTASSFYGVVTALRGIWESPYSKYEVEDDFENEVRYLYISTNLRVVYEYHKLLYDAFMEHNGEQFDFDDNTLILNVKNCKFEDYPDWFHKRITIKFTMDRVGSQSFCRHRVFSFAQESTRFVNYLKEKFGSEIAVIQPCWLKPEDQQEFESDMAIYEQIYFKWINKGYKAEEARAFLPFDVKTEIIMTGFTDAWEHFFELRNDSHAHSQAQELAKPLEEYFKEKGYI